jgi:hypothetical protein
LSFLGRFTFFGFAVFAAGFVERVLSSVCPGVTFLASAFAFDAINRIAFEISAFPTVHHRDRFQFLISHQN